MITAEQIGQQINETLQRAMNSDGQARLADLDKLIELTDKRKALTEGNTAA